VRTNTEPMTVAGSIRNELKGIDPTLPLSNVMTMRAIADNVLAKPRLNLLLIGIFAVLALILAVVGIYSVMSYVASQRTREIGVRMALGAQSHQVFWLIIWQGMSLVLVGLAVGMAGALLLSRLMATLLYGVTVTDPLTLLSAPLLLAAIALFACYFPARKAMRLDPVDALRYE
jgi:putative ABC transport system permease protein